MVNKPLWVTEQVTKLAQRSVCPNLTLLYDSFVFKISLEAYTLAEGKHEDLRN